MKEKRSQPRFEVCLDLQWQGSGAHYNVRIADISEGGCYVDTILEVTKGEILFLKMLMPEGDWFDVQGVVAHHSLRLGFGVRFINLNEEQRRRIRLLVHQVNPARKESPRPSLFFERIPEVPLPLGQIDVTCHEVM